jgi:hypothetical protein
VIDVKSIQENIIGSITEVGVAEEVTIQRNQFNKFNEPMDDPIDICKINGFYHGKNSYFNINIGEGGVIATGRKEYFLILLDEEGQKVHEGDFFERKGVKYKITDLGENMGILNDMLLERM